MVRRSRSEWEALVGAFERSGEDAGAFAARRGVSTSTLRWWRSRLRSAGRRELDFVDVVVEEAAPVVSEPFVVEVATGHRVVVPVGFDAGELRRLVAALC